MTPGLTGATLDRADRLRNDPEALAMARADPRARLLKLDGLAPEVDETGALGWTSLSHAPAEAELILLGIENGQPHFAAWNPASTQGEPSPMRSPAITAALSTLRASEAAVYAMARSISEWHTRHRFCANCGQPTTIFRGGWARSCGHCGAEHFPRVDPVVIMIAEHRGRALLGRGPGWPEGRYSALAGFLEPGESIEEAVAREIAEESGVRVNRVRYIASQPWPFPSSLMIACIAEAENDTITIDPHEIEDAIWVEREQVRAVLAGAATTPFLPPPPYAIAYTLLTAWAEEG